jgi:hypothetical protein
MPVKRLSFKVTDGEARLIRSLARRENLSLSEYLRRRATGAGGAVGIPGRVKCEFTGATIFAPLVGHPPLDTASVHEILTEFA